MESLKQKRPYHSPRHAELRRQTRRDILGAAHRLFAERGYAQTTIEQIATEAGVAVQTVYAAFGNKRAIVLALLDTVVAGDDEPVPVIDQIARAVEGVEEPAARLARAIRFGSRAMERSAEVRPIVRSAAAVDDEVRAGFLEGEARRYQDARSIIELVTPKQVGRAARQRAADVLFALHNQDIYEVLVGQRGWSRRRWEGWVRASVGRELGLDDKET